MWVAVVYCMYASDSMDRRWKKAGGMGKRASEVIRSGRIHRWRYAECGKRRTRRLDTKLLS